MRKRYVVHSRVPVLLACCLLAAGCTQTPCGNPVTLDTSGVSPKVDYTRLTAVLKSVVNKQGLVMRWALCEENDTLNEQLRLLAVTGPTATPSLFPTAEDRLAYWYNARAAWSMKLVMLCGFPPALEEGMDDRLVQLDGRMMSLKDIDNILAADGDWRTLVVAPGVALYRAALPREAMDGKGIREAIDGRFNELAGDGLRFIVDIDKHEVLVPPALWAARTRIIAEYEKTYCTTGANLLTAMLPYLRGSSQRRIRNAIGYRVAPVNPPWHLGIVWKEYQGLFIEQ